MDSAVLTSNWESNMTKTEATKIAREAKAMQHLAGTEDVRLANACEDNGYAIPAEYSYLYGANDTIANLAATVLKFAQPLA